MSILGNLFGTQKAVDNILDNEKGLLVRAGGWFNDLSYTEAERAKATADQREWGIRQLEALAPFKVVQRILAFAATFMWIFAAANVFAAMWLTDDKRTENMLAFALSDYIFWPVITVYALYFSGGVVDSLKRKLTSK